jgi:hypothetical protein
MDATNADRARAGLLPRKPPPGKAAPGPSRPAPVEAPARVPAAPEPVIAVVQEPGDATGFRLVDVVLAAMRSRVPADEVDAAGGSVRADTSLESLGVRVRDPLVESRLVGRAGELTVAVQTGGRSQETGTVPGPAVAAAVPDVGPAPVVTSGAEVPQPLAAASPRRAAPVLAAAPSPQVPSGDEPSRYKDVPGLVSRWKTSHGEVRERWLDSSGLVIERQVDPPDPGWQRVIDVSKLTLVSQRREDDGGIVQVVQDVSGAHIEVTRDPMGRLLQARVLRR